MDCRHGCLFGKSKISDLIYKIIFLLFIVIGAAANMDAVWGFQMQ